MDKGSKTYTSFDWSEDIVEYRMDNPESLDWIVGHIHSHNDMPVFFSGTDWSELNDNSPQHNYYLSVIVNNFMDIQAKIAFTGEMKNFICKDEEGKDYVMKLNNSSLNPIMFVYTCEPKWSQIEVTVSDQFVERLMQVEQKAEKRFKQEEEERRKKLQNTTSVKNPVVNGNFKEQTKSPFPDYNPKQITNGATLWDSYKHLEEEDDELNIAESVEEEFACFVLRLGNEVSLDTLETALEETEAILKNADGVSPQSIADSITVSYGAFYERFFEKLPKYAGDQKFMDVLEEVIIMFEENAEQYKFLDPITESLKSLGAKFEVFTKENQII